MHVTGQKLRADTRSMSTNCYDGYNVIMMVETDIHEDFEEGTVGLTGRGQLYLSGHPDPELRIPPIFRGEGRHAGSYIVDQESPDVTWAGSVVGDRHPTLSDFDVIMQRVIQWTCFFRSV